jgi:hypothetical protein
MLLGFSAVRTRGFRLGGPGLSLCRNQGSGRARAWSGSAKGGRGAGPARVRHPRDMTEVIKQDEGAFAAMADSRNALPTKHMGAGGFERGVWLVVARLALTVGERGSAISVFQVLWIFPRTLP